MAVVGMVVVAGMAVVEDVAGMVVAVVVGMVGSAGLVAVVVEQ